MVNKQVAVFYAAIAVFAAYFAGHYQGKSQGAETYEAIHKWLSPTCKKDVERVTRNLDQQWSRKDTE